MVFYFTKDSLLQDNDIVVTSQRVHRYVVKSTPFAMNEGQNVRKSDPIIVFSEIMCNFAHRLNQIKTTLRVIITVMSPVFKRENEYTFKM